MEVEIEFVLGPDVKNGEPRLWLYADRSQWPTEVRAQFAEGPHDAIVQLGDHRIAARIKADDGDGERTYVAAHDGSLRGASWPGHRVITEILRAMELGAGDSIRTQVTLPVDARESE